MNSRKLLGTIIAVIGIIVVVAGATFAYYTATASNSTVVNGTASSASLSLTVTLQSSSATGSLVPQLTSTLGNAVGATTSCVDTNGNTVCKVYKITITNNGSSTAKISATFALTATSGSTFTNLKWEELQSATAVKSSRTTNASSTTTWLSNVSIASGASNKIERYIAVFVAETNTVQNNTDKGSFTGTVTVNTGSGTGLTSTFTS